MRAFIALEMSDDIKSALERVESRLKCSGADVKWIDPRNIHLTIKFLGDITENRCADRSSLLDDVAKSEKPFDITLNAIGAFPKVEHPRVIWIGLDKGASEAGILADHVDEELSKIGFDREERSFSPHLTIGRVRSSLNMEKLRDKMISAASSLPFSGIAPHRVSSVSLFRSTLTPHGSIYTKLHESTFKA